MELPHIGQHCDAENCNQLDFLPFKCDACGKVFCLQHRSRLDHNCPACEESDRPEFQGERSYPCSVLGCERRELTPVVCQHCQNNFCLKHRLQEDHSCPKLPEKKPEVSKTTQHVQNIIGQKEFKPRAAPTNPKAIQMAAKISLMKLKGKASGDQGLPQSERIYFNVLLPLSSGKLPMPLFFSKVWSIGRIIDVIADKAGITNVNNTGAEKKLRLFHADTGNLLPTDKQLSDLMEDTQLYLLNGASVVFEHVSDDVLVLENVKQYKR